MVENEYTVWLYTQRHGAPFTGSLLFGLIRRSGGRFKPVSPVTSIDSIFRAVPSPSDLPLRAFGVVLVDHPTEETIVGLPTPLLRLHEFPGPHRHGYSSVCVRGIRWVGSHLMSTYNDTTWG